MKTRKITTVALTMAFVAAMTATSFAATKFEKSVDAAKYANAVHAAALVQQDDNLCVSGQEVALMNGLKASYVADKKYSKAERSAWEAQYVNSMNK